MIDHGAYTKKSQTWSTLVLSHPPIRLEIIGTLMPRVLFFLVPSILFLAFDSIIPSLAVGIKTQGASALPTRAGGVRASKRKGAGPPWFQVIGLSIFNIILGVAVQAGIEFLFTEVINIRSALKVMTTLPMPWSIAKDVVRGLLLREVLKPYQNHITQSMLISYRSSNTISIDLFSTRTPQIY